MELFGYMEDIYFQEYDQFRKEVDRRRERMMFSDPSLLEEKGIILDFETITEIPNGRFDIRYRGVLFECVFFCKPHSPLYVILNGALTADPPQFSRWSYYPFLNGSMLNIADPMYKMYDGLKLGWYYGNENLDLREYLARVVEKIASILQVDNKNIIFFGSSGGGAAVIETANHLAGAKSVAVNPQIILSEYYVYAEEFEKITHNDLKKDEIWNRNNAIYHLKNFNQSFHIIIINLRSPLDMKQLNNICMDLGITLKYGINIFEHFAIWIYDGECEPFMDGHCTQEFYCIFFVIEYLLEHVKENYNYSELIRLINEFWYYHWYTEKNLRRQIPNMKILLQCREQNEKNVIWGGGNIAKDLAKKIFDIHGENYYKIMMVIDSNREKKGKLFEGKLLIEHPDCIKDWSEYFVIITTEKCEAIQGYLESVGLIYRKNFILYKDLYK